LRPAAGRDLVLLTIMAMVAVTAGTPAGQTPGGDPNTPGLDMNGPYDPVPDWYKAIHPGTLQCGSGVAVETPNRIYVVTEVEVPAGHQGACTPERYKFGAHSHNILVLDGNGKVVEDWKQWDNLFGYGNRSGSIPTIRPTLDRQPGRASGAQTHARRQATRHDAGLAPSASWQ